MIDAERNHGRTLLGAPNFSECSEERRVVNMGDVLTVRQLTHGAPEPLHINLVGCEVWGKDEVSRAQCGDERSGRTDLRFEHHEEVIIVMRVDGLAERAKILCAVGTSEPLARDPLHAAIADGEPVDNVLQVC